MAGSMHRTCAVKARGELLPYQEALRIGREAHLPVEIFHLKVSGKSRAGSMTRIVWPMIQEARDAGQE